MAEELEKETEQEESSGSYSEQEGKKLSGGLVKMLMMVASALVGIILMVVVSNIVYNVKSSGGGDEQKEVIWAPGVTPKKEPFQTMLINQLKMNLSDPTGTNPVFVQMEMALAYEQSNLLLQNELLNRKYEMRDKIITLISSKTYEDINTPDKIQGLKKEIKNQVNTLLINGLIEDIYLIDFNAVPRS